MYRIVFLFFIGVISWTKTFSQEQFAGCWEGSYTTEIDGETMKAMVVRFNFKRITADKVYADFMFMDAPLKVSSIVEDVDLPYSSETKAFKLNIPVSIGKKQVPGAYWFSVSGRKVQTLNGEFRPDDHEHRVRSSFKLTKTESFNFYKPVKAFKTKAARKDIGFVDADRMMGFQEGFSVIQKGNLSAIINDDGKVVVPYGKYAYTRIGSGISNVETGFRNGTCVVSNPEYHSYLGLIDTSGKLLLPIDNYSVEPADAYGWASYTDKKHKHWFFHVSGVSVKIPKVFLQARTDNNAVGAIFSGPDFFEEAHGEESMAVFAEGVSVGKDKEKGLYGYYTRFGLVVIKPQFKDASPFSEGLACVSKSDEFGVIRYGFINLKGETIIPFKFSKKPGNFSNGLAYVEPATQETYNFCFVNKQGEIVFKQKDRLPLDLEGKRVFKDGYFRMITPGKPYADLHYIDTAGNTIAAIAALKDKVVTSIVYYDNRYRYFSFYNKIQVFFYKDENRDRRIGFVNLKNGKTQFTRYSNMTSFDPTTGLAVADETVALDESGREILEIKKVKSEF